MRLLFSFKYWQLLYHLVLTELVSRRLCVKMNGFSGVVFIYLARALACVYLSLKFKHAYCSVSIEDPVLGSPRSIMQISTHWN